MVLAQRNTGFVGSPASCKGKLSDDRNIVTGRRRMGRIRDVQCPTCYLARRDALQYLLLPALASTVTPFLDAPMPEAG